MDLRIMYIIHHLASRQEVTYLIIYFARLDGMHMNHKHFRNTNIFLQIIVELTSYENPKIKTKIVVCGSLRRISL